MAHWDAERRRSGDKQASWLKFLRQDVRDDPTLVLHEEFRQKFPVTSHVFDRIVDALKGTGMVQDPRVRKAGAPPIPAELKSSTYSECWWWERSTMLSKKDHCAMKRLSKFCASNQQALGLKVSLIGLWITSMMSGSVRPTGKK